VRLVGSGDAGLSLDDIDLSCERSEAFGGAGTANIARSATDGRVQALGSDLAHPMLGLLVLLAVQVLNIYKPRGVTKVGQKRHNLAAVIRST
jgi:hypothetical protein